MIYDFNVTVAFSNRLTPYIAVLQLTDRQTDRWTKPTA